ncbi:4Fe-4S dicluster domain-containing protein [Natranaerobius trueperi]|uniref:4Fe-4S ferredoxin-type domain-containing protein n=1 Tax=Natranaerobius trueperi TaxID=759412 RepID=A0A226C002_9FIRM|nr:4Fe-4S dicluster domain-containing protein [Natranaerobius trueperi]OWZ83677.1 hypothetical protein CDO51_06920 [Natranaerobius trueperi]
MVNLQDYTMLFDESICAGCEACTVACKQIHELPNEVFRTKMAEIEWGDFPNVASVFNKNACYHCEDAACIKACPTGACHKSEEGLTVMNSDVCINCNWCVTSCPFGYIAPDRSNGVMEKCSMCEERLREGKDTLCKETCTTRAIKGGSRDEMIRYGRKRVEKLKEQGFNEANLYGEKQLGGLKVLSVLRYDPEKYSLPKDPQIPLSLSLWNKLPLGPTVLIAGGFLVAFNFFHNRKFKDKINKSTDSDEYGSE